MHRLIIYSWGDELSSFIYLFILKTMVDDVSNIKTWSRANPLRTILCMRIKQTSPHNKGLERAYHLLYSAFMVLLYRLAHSHVLLIKDCPPKLHLLSKLEAHIDFSLYSRKASPMLLICWKYLPRWEVFRLKKPPIATLNTILSLRAWFILMETILWK